MLSIKEHHLVLADIYKQVSKDFDESHNLPMSGRYYERTNHEQDVAKECLLSVDRISQSLKNVVREYIREKMKGGMSFEEAQEVVCVSEAFIVLKMLGVSKIDFYDQKVVVL